MIEYEKVFGNHRCASVLVGSTGTDRAANNGLELMEHV